MKPELNNLKRKNELLLEKLAAFYKNQTNTLTMLAVLKGQTPLSLRLLDWLITNYSKSNKVAYYVTDAVEGRRSFSLYNSYKAQLKAYSKKQFDPFCRRDRTFITVESESVETTPAQLNFFRWAISNDVLLYALDNIPAIEHDMLIGGKKKRGGGGAPKMSTTKVEETIHFGRVK